MIAHPSASGNYSSSSKKEHSSSSKPSATQINYRFCVKCYSTNFHFCLVSIIFIVIIADVSLSFLLPELIPWSLQRMNSQDTQEMGLKFWHEESFANLYRVTVHKLYLEDKRTLEKWMCLSRTYTCYDVLKSVRLLFLFGKLASFRSLRMRRLPVLHSGREAF